MAEPFTPNNQLTFANIAQGPGAPSSPHQNRNLDGGIEKQNQIRGGIGHYNNADMFICETKPFLAHYGPHKADIDSRTLNKCMKRLSEGKNAVLQEYQDGGKVKYAWKDYQKSPKESGLTENKAFVPMGKIMQAVLKDQDRKDLCFELIPNTELKSDIRGSTHKIDGCFIDKPHDPAPLLNRQIKVPVEFKHIRHSVWRTIVHLQILGACHHILNEDPRRKWMYGLTIEDTMASVWYFSRSHSVKSIAFDWIKDPALFVRVLLSFSKATHEELGVDPTVHVGPVDKEGCAYVYEVPGPRPGKSLFFKTEKTRVPQRSLCIAGRTTRVWEVTQVTSAAGDQEVSPKKVILKDVWLDASDDYSKTEAQNMDAIFLAVDSFVDKGLEIEIRRELDIDKTATRKSLLANPATMERLMTQFINHEKRFQDFDDDTKKRLCVNLTDKRYRSLFLTKLHAWTGDKSRSVAPEASRVKKLFYQLSIDEAAWARQVEEEYKKRRGLGIPSFNNFTIQDQQKAALKDDTRDYNDKYRRFAPKLQSRFIYEEVCTPLENLATLGEAVDILCQAVDALHILFAVGWVHRDISPSNILAFRAKESDPWTVKLADLEFSRVMIDKNRPPRSDPRTGTPFFMPVEIMRRKFFCCELRTRFPSQVNNLAKGLGLEPADERYQFLSRFRNIDLTAYPVTVPTNPRFDEVPTSSITAVNHNFQHDLESIWWILVWFITCRIGCNDTATVAQKLFRRDVNEFAGREAALQVYSTMAELEIQLPEDLAIDFAPVIEKLRSSMFQSYMLRGVFGHNEVPESYSYIHGLFATKLRGLQAKGGPWSTLKLSDEMEFEEPPPTRKHNRDDDEDDLPYRSTRARRDDDDD